MRPLKTLVITAGILALINIGLTIIGGRPTVRPGVRTVTVEGTVAARRDNVLTVTITKRRGLMEFLSSAGARELTVAVTASTTVQAIHTADRRVLTGPQIRTVPLAFASLRLDEEVRVVATPSLQRPNQLVARTLTVIRIVPPRTADDALPRAGPQPRPSLLR